jgi:hypothetical protein
MDPWTLTTIAAVSLATLWFWLSWRWRNAGRRIARELEERAALASAPMRYAVPPVPPARPHQPTVRFPPPWAIAAAQTRAREAFQTDASWQAREAADRLARAAWEARRQEFMATFLKGNS